MTDIEITVCEKSFLFRVYKKVRPLSQAESQGEAPRLVRRRERREQHLFWFAWEEMDKAE